MFGSFPQESFNIQESLIGVGINSSQQQRELRDFKKQGQGGQTSPDKIINTQDDLLDYLVDGEEDDEAKQMFAKILD